MHENEGRRIITACFASHIHRIQQIADAAQAFGRKIAPLGRSMRRNISVAREMGVLSIPEHVLIDIDDIDRYEPGQICVVSTGSQGEAMSALALLAGNENRWLKITPDDTVILSSHPIPGNEHAVTKVIDNLVRLGAEVVHSGIEDVHATGHAKEEELKLFLSVARPEWFVPVHGEYRHLVAHARLARLMGVGADHVVVAEDGDQLILDDDGVRLAGRVPADYVLRPRHDRRRRDVHARRAAHPRRRGRRRGDRLRRPRDPHARRAVRRSRPGAGSSATSRASWWRR